MPYRKLCSAPHTRALSGKGVTQIMHEALRLAHRFRKGRRQCIRPTIDSTQRSSSLPNDNLSPGQDLTALHGRGTPKNRKARWKEALSSAQPSYATMIVASYVRLFDDNQMTAAETLISAAPVMPRRKASP
jgi:hypothetical protein